MLRYRQQFPETINWIFDVFELVTKRLPILHQFIVEVVIIVLAVLGAISLVRGHP